MLLLHPIGFQLSCFHCYLFLEIFFISLLLSSVTCWIFRNILFILHVFLFFKDFACNWYPVSQLEKAMAPHSSTLAWKTPWTEEPGRLQSMGSLSQTQLSNFTFTFHFHALEKAMATHASVLAWRIPGTGEPDGLQSMGSHRVGHD